MTISAFSIPKVQMILALSVILGSALVIGAHLSSEAFLSVSSILAVTLTTDFVCLKLRRQPLFPLWAAVVTGMIIALLTAPSLLGAGLVAGILAMLSKHFIHTNQKHIFNPAAFGLFFSHLLFHTSVSWWGVTFQQPSLSFLPLLLFGILLLPGLVSIGRLHRQRIVATFLILYFMTAYSLHRSNPSFSLSGVFFGNLTLFFFSLVMLPEPMTSPNTPKEQFWYGGVVEVIFVCLSLPALRSLATLLPDLLLPALLVGNLAFSGLFKKRATQSL